MIYTEANIIYFEPFYFKNGNTAKEKYLLVLKHHISAISI
jgi:hypothetical protein